MNLPPNFNPNAGGQGRLPANSAEAMRLSQRVEELLLDRATMGLTAAEEAELELALARLGRPLDEGFDLAAAATDLALTPAHERAPAMPADLRSRIMAAGTMWAQQQRSPSADHQAEQAARLTLVGLDDHPAERRGGGRGNADWRTWGGWLAAAACLTFAIYTKVSMQPAADSGSGDDTFRPTTASLADIVRSTLGLEAPQDEAVALVRKLKFIDNADTIVTPILSVTGDTPSVTATLGEVVWSCSAQKGAIVLRGLAPLSCASDTYQLWIYDAMRDSRYPVSAGTFRVNASGTTIVEFDPAVKISHAERFAITVERDGGVLISDLDDLTAASPEPASESSSPVDAPAPAPEPNPSNMSLHGASQENATGQ